jgi:hypothetical protein
MYYDLETKIKEDVKKQKPDYLLNSEVFGQVPVAETGETIDDTEAVIVVITDEQFAKERLRVAEKHLRDYENLPDKGQFPFVKFNKSDKMLVFTGTRFIPNKKDAKDEGSLVDI